MFKKDAPKTGKGTTKSNYGAKVGKDKGAKTQRGLAKVYDRTTKTSQSIKDK